MPDPFVRVGAGDPLRISATAWNAMLDAAKDVISRKGKVGADALTQDRSSTIIRVRNDTGMPLERASVVGLDGPIFSPADSSIDAFMREISFRAVVPDLAKHRRRFAVMLDAVPAEEGRVARAYLSGLCQVRVNLIHETHEYANIDNGSVTAMKSSRHGHARILWREGEEGYGYGGPYAEGPQWAIVMLGVTGSSFAVGKALDGIPARSGSTYGSGRVAIYRSHTGAYSDPTQDGPVEIVDVLNASSTAFASGMGIDADMAVAVGWDADDVAWVSPLECESTAPYGPPYGPYYG